MTSTLIPMVPSETGDAIFIDRLAKMFPEKRVLLNYRSIERMTKEGKVPMYNVSADRLNEKGPEIRQVVNGANKLYVAPASVTFGREFGGPDNYMIFRQD